MEKGIVCRVSDRILMIVVLDEDKEVGPDPMKSAVSYRKSLRTRRYDKGLECGCGQSPKNLNGEGR